LLTKWDEPPSTKGLFTNNQAVKLISKPSLWASTSGVAIIFGDMHIYAYPLYPHVCWLSHQTTNQNLVVMMMICHYEDVEFHKGWVLKLKTFKTSFPFPFPMTHWMLTRHLSHWGAS